MTSEGGQNWTPITPPRGSNLHAETHPEHLRRRSEEAPVVGMLLVFLEGQSESDSADDKQHGNKPNMLASPWVMKGIRVFPDRSCCVRNDRMTEGAVMPQMGNPRKIVSESWKFSTPACSDGLRYWANQVRCKWTGQ
jgi:hypothetical protein